MELRYVVSTIIILTTSAAEFNFMCCMLAMGLLQHRQQIRSQSQEVMNGAHRGVHAPIYTITILERRGSLTHASVTPEDTSVRKVVVDRAAKGSAASRSSASAPVNSSI